MMSCWQDANNGRLEARPTRELLPTWFLSACGMESLRLVAFFLLFLPALLRAQAPAAPPTLVLDLDGAGDS